MSYLTISNSISKVTSSNGNVIPCNYIEHPRFSFSCEMCIALHYVLCKFAPIRSYSKVYELRKGINQFLDYVVIFESNNPVSFSIDKYEKITAEHIISFDHFNIKTKAQKGLASRFKGAMETISVGFDDGLPILVFPKLDEVKSTPREPFEEHTHKGLEKTLKQHTAKIEEKIKFRDTVNKAKAYSLIELNSIDPNEFFNWEPCPKRVLKTLLTHNHPYGILLDSRVENFAKAISGLDKVETVIDYIYCRFNHSNRFTSKVKIPKISEILGLYYPTLVDQTAMVLFLMFQSGWNKETVIAIDPDNFLHPLNSLLNTSKALIISEKNKSQSSSKPFDNPKAFLALSDKNDKYSMHSLISLAKKLSEPLVVFQSDRVEHTGKNKLFLCMQSWSKWCGASKNSNHVIGRIVSISEKKMWSLGVEYFFENYEIKEKGKRFVRAKDIEGRFRPNWIQFTKEDKKHSLGLLATQQGHKSKSTTDKHYDMSASANNKRKKRLRIEFNEILAMFWSGGFKGLLVNKKQKIDFKTLDTIFTIPGHEKPFWACANRKKPDWEGFEEVESSIAKCNRIDKCLGCSQVRIFVDSLPYIIEVQAAKEQKQSFLESDHNSALKDDIEICNYIIDEWGNDEDLKKALRYQRMHAPLLPADLSLLSILFEE